MPYPSRRLPLKLLWMTVAIILCVTAIPSAATTAERPALPPDLVYLRDVDPTIIQDIRYATENNFTGQPVTGYEAAECLLKKSAATALARVQNDLKVQGMSLMVYDCYRPQRAVSALVAWTRDLSESRASKRFHPRLSKSQLLAQGYIASRSNHSRGVAVDAALVRLPPPDPGVFDPGKQYEECADQKDKRAPDPSIDFGTGFDCFDSKSHTDAKRVTNDQTCARAKLVAAMAKHGFANYKREWWHFTFGADDTGRSFDVPVNSHMEQAKN